MAFRMPDGEITTCKAVTDTELYDYFRGDLYKRLPEQVVLEEWSYFSNKVTPDGNYTADLCAGIRAICYLLAIPLALRTPGMRNPRQVAAESWYKQAFHVKTLYKIHSHECDALAHLLAWEALHPELQRQYMAQKGITRSG